MEVEKVTPIETAKLHRTPIRKARINPQVYELIKKHYQSLYLKLVYQDDERDIFHDVVLSMTYKYKGGDFMEEFKKEFNSHKARHQKAKRINAFLLRSINTAHTSKHPDDLE